ncbi:MAG TPA: helix-turn-helix domain-containing protein [Geothrix sp.]|nr:helix-turn-helix domain-containing protein [Geothrix sp.]
MSKLDQQNQPAGRALLDPKAAAAYLDLSEWTLAEWRCRGNGPRYFKISNRVRYSLAELNIWLEARSVVSTSEHDAKKAG